ncbi:MAG: sulfurtransferase [Gemmatimonadaceae bacterium]
MSSIRRSALVASFMLVITAALAPLPAQGPTAPLVVSTSWLSERLTDPGVVVVHVEHGDYADGHIPGARSVAYGALSVRRGTVTTELPEPDSLRTLFASLGISDASHVVVYAHEGPMATRMLYTLAYIGHAKYSLLDGGLEQWTAEKRPVTKDVPAMTPGVMTPRALRPVVADADWVHARLGKPGLSLIDTRTTGEYNGTGNRSGMPSAGHLAGALQLEWEQLFADGSVRLKPRAELERLYAARVKPGDSVVTYCWIGYRGSATWFVAHYLGYEAKLYDGSYQDWSQRGMATRAGATP